jgi:hypothetical protein
VGGKILEAGHACNYDRPGAAVNLSASGLTTARAPSNFRPR